MVTAAIKKVAIIGGNGQMGRQIGLNTALYGIDVYIYVRSQESYKKAQDWVNDYIKGRLDKGKMTQEEADKGLAKFHIVTTLEEAAADADLVIESISEDRKIKEDIFKQLDKIARPDAILTTNSSIMVSSMFKDIVSNPGRLANLHYFNPALVMKVVEIVQGPHTSEETVQRLIEFCKNTGKKPVWLKKEIDGFIANRILRAITSEALYLLEEGVATPEDIDTAVENGLGHPMGPFKVMDFSGLDSCYFAARNMFEETGYRKPGIDLLKEKYEKGELGRKSGKGWYDYNQK